MAELASITEALKMLEGFTPVQRVLLTCTGTLQGTLSAYFGEVIEVQVVRQLSLKLGIYSREVRLFTSSNNKTVCVAYSSIKTNSPEVIELIDSQSLGIGQILEKLGLKPGFKLCSVSQGETHFHRTYELDASVDGIPTVYYRITESFPAGVYR